MNSVPHEVFELFHKYGKMMASQGYPLGEEARMLLDRYDGVYGTKKGADFSNLKWKDVVKQSDQHFATHKSGMHARVVSQTPYCQQCLQEGVTFQAALDDMAQIIGPKAVIANMTQANKKKGAKEMAVAASNAAGFFVQDRVKDGLPAGYTLTVGRNLYEAVAAMTVLEKAAETHLKSRVLGGTKPLSGFTAKQMRKNYKENYSAAEAAEKETEMSEGIAAEDAAAEIWDGRWDARETELRQKLVDYGNKLVETGLVQGTWGNLSIRLNDKYMLVTPSGLDYARLTPADMVKVDLQTMKHEGGLKPTSEKGLHAAIYRERPAVNAIVHTHSRYCSMFAAAQAELPVEDAEAQKVFGTSIGLAKYAKAGSDKLAKYTAAALGRNFGALMSNHGMVTCGADMESAFANCQLREKTAEVYIESRL